MRLDKLAVTAQEAFQASMGVAGDAQSSTIEPIHLLKAMLDASENNLSAIIKRIGADPAQLSRNVDDAIAAMQADGTLDELYARWGLSEDGVSGGVAAAQGGGSHA